MAILNLTIINEFIKLADKIKYFDIDNSKTKEEKQKNLFRLSKIENAIKIIKQYSTKIKNGYELQEIPNIGKKIIARIDEILKNGKLNELVNYNQNENIIKQINELTSIFGIGKNFALKLINNYNIHSIDELIVALSKNKLKVSKLILTSLRYRNILKKNIKYDIITQIFIKLKNVIGKINNNYICVVCGSHRRNKPISRDIDLLITSKTDNKKNDIKIIVSKLKSEKIIVDSLTADDVKTKYMGLLKFNNDVYKIDIRFVNYDSFYTSLLYFTGSGKFNEKMRRYAKTKGFKLNEYGIFDKNKKIIVNSEKEIFDHLDLEFVEPQNRN